MQITIYFSYWISLEENAHQCLAKCLFLDFPGGSDGKESACNVGDLGSIPGLGRSPGVGCGKPLQNSYLENRHGQRSLAGYCPWGRKELDTTEWLSTTQHECSNYLLGNSFTLFYCQCQGCPCRGFDFLTHQCAGRGEAHFSEVKVPPSTYAISYKGKLAKTGGTMEP